MLYRLVIAGIVVVAALTAQAPGGFKTYENKLAPVVFFYPIVYKEVPLPPTEQTLVAQYLMEDKPAELARLDDGIFKAIHPQLYVYCFDVVAPETGAEAGDEKTGPKTVREAMEKGSRVGSWQEFCKRFDDQWELIEDKRNPGHYSLRYTAEWGLRDVRPIGRLIMRQEGGTTFGIFGFAPSPYEKTFDRQFDKMAKGLALADADAGEQASEKIDKIYESGEYIAVEQRKQARSELARGWKVYDTPHFLIVHHAKRDALIKRIGRDIEAMRLVYMDLFPPTGPMDRLAIVRVCQTREEYFQYGGPPSSGGFWHSGNEELVFFDYSYTQKTLSEEEKEMRGGQPMTDDDSFIVLYHEALHQYIHYAIGEFAPHDWFNEGHGDYFSGSQIDKRTGKFSGVGPNPWRLHRVKDMCELGKGFVPLTKILHAERAEFYNRARAGFYYAGAWSFVYFLIKSEEAQAHPKWSKILPTYFETSKTAYAEELAKLGDSPDLGQKQIAQFETRKRALAASLEGVEIAELEAAWKRFVIEMKDPWPALRKARAR
jgi:hypothetical protein